MPINKNASFRYRVIDNCLKNRGRKWTLQDLIDEVSEKLQENLMSEQGVSKRTIQYDLNIMRSERPRGFDAPIVCENGYYFYEDKDYSIDQNPLNETDLANLQQAVDLLRQFSGLPHYIELEQIVGKILGTITRQETAQNPVIHFDFNPLLVGLEYIHPLYNAILAHRTVHLAHHPFEMEESRHFDFQPYFLKEFNSRWFVFGKVIGSDRIIPLALDRIKSITMTNDYFEKDGKIKPGLYLTNIIGITLDENQSLTRIRLWFSNRRAPYIITKPIHTSQEILSNDKDGLVIELEVIPNRELLREIISFGDDCKVLAPDEIADEVMSLFKKALEKYNKD
ncbi:MAG: WYL domain-containing protein [Bacteroidales bacterium]|nr:WYL domain-containing protein [Bacteroidales bacterium]